MSYSQVQFFGYQIDAHPFTLAELEVRCRVLEHVIAEAAADPPDPEVLKVFMAPDRFLHGNGSPGERQAVLERMHQLTGRAAFRDWLFVYGSAVQRGGLCDPAAVPGDSLFEIEGITFGLELCLDHARQRLRSVRPAPGERFPQIQLVPSAGLDIEEDSVATGKDGLIFNVDATHVRLKKNLASARRQPRLWPAERRDDIVERAWSFVRLDFLGRDVWRNHFHDEGWLVRYEPVDVPCAEVRAA
jgi:hypothetical protein